MAQTMYNIKCIFQLLRRPTLKNIITKIRSALRRAFRITEVRYVLWALLTVIISEALSTGPIRAITYPFVRPLPFLAAPLIVLCTYFCDSPFQKTPRHLSSYRGHLAGYRHCQLHTPVIPRKPSFRC